MTEFNTQQLVALRYALEDPGIASQVATLPFLVKEEDKVRVFQNIGTAMRRASDVCAHCTMPRYQHLAGKCLFEATIFENAPPAPPERDINAWYARMWRASNSLKGSPP